MPRSCASTRRPLSPPDATPHPSSTTLAASARTVLVRLVELSRPVRLTPAARAEAKTLRSLSPHRSPDSSPTPRSPSNRYQPLLTASNQSDSKPIDPQPSSNGSLHIVVTQATPSAVSRPPLLGSLALQHLDMMSSARLLSISNHFNDLRPPASTARAQPGCPPIGHVPSPPIRPSARPFTGLPPTGLSHQTGRPITPVTTRKNSISRAHNSNRPNHPAKRTPQAYKGTEGPRPKPSVTYTTKPQIEPPPKPSRDRKGAVPTEKTGTVPSAARATRLLAALTSGAPWTVPSFLQPLRERSQPAPTEPERPVTGLAAATSPKANQPPRPPALLTASAQEQRQTVPLCATSKHPARDVFTKRTPSAAARTEKRHKNRLELFHSVPKANKTRTPTPAFYQTNSRRPTGSTAQPISGSTKQTRGNLMMLEHYSHVRMEAKREAVGKLSSGLMGKPLLVAEDVARKVS